MSEFMTRTIKRKKYLFWFDFGDKVKVVEFRVCDCFLDQILIFRNKLSSVGEFTDDLKELLFDNIPIIPDIADDIFLIYGKKSIACCETALYQFDYRKFICHNKMYDECSAYEIECNCLYLLEKKLSCFNALCSNCHYNLIKMVSNRFIKIKNDKCQDL